MSDVDWAIERIRDYRRTGDPTDLASAAGIMMENCQTDERITVADAFAFLDFPGLIAEFGARILYIKTGRDGIYDRSAAEDDVCFSADRADWHSYLVKNGYSV